MSTDLVIKDEMLMDFLNISGVATNLTQQEKESFINISKAFGLNPFKREIHISKYGTNLSIITGYEVYIKRAERSGQLDGWSVTTEGSVQNGDLKAIVTIHRKDRKHPFIWEANYVECVQTTRDGAVTKFWQKAIFMTKKVAIAQAFRLCFSDELGGMPYTSDELPSMTEDVSYEVVNETKQLTEEKKAIPELTEKQLNTVLSKDLATLNKCMAAIEKGELIADSEQILIIGNKIVELKTLGNE